MWLAIFSGLNKCVINWKLIQKLAKNLVAIVTDLLTRVSKIIKGILQLNEIETLSQQLGEKLTKLGWTITTAESCTGGGISAAITEVVGSSAYFQRAFITYSNEAKSEMLGISLPKINQFGAVSEQTVEAMAKGAAKKANANIAIAVSGIAGPGGGSIEKPVGTVWTSIVIQQSLDKKDEITVENQCFLFSGDRCNVRLETIKSCLNKVLAMVG